MRLGLREERKGPTGPETLQVWLWQYLALAKLHSKVTKFLPLKKQLEIQRVSDEVSPFPLPGRLPQPVSLRHPDIPLPTSFGDGVGRLATGQTQLSLESFLLEARSAPPASQAFTPLLI